MASADVTAELRCSICMEIYRDPVTLPCGHNFCRGCITQAWDHQVLLREYKCPECQKIYRRRPELVRNTTLHNIAEAFHSIETDPQKKKCSVHNELITYFCTNDNAYVCVSCSMTGEHAGHKVMSIDKASEMMKGVIRNSLQKLKTETEEAEKRVQSLEERRKKAQEKADSETERVTALFRDIRRQLDGLEKRVLSDITKQAQRVSQSYKDAIQQLEIKKEELSRKMCPIKELCKMTDPLTVLQESDTGDLFHMEDRERHDKQLHDGGDLDVAGISHTLHTGLSDIMYRVIVQKCTYTQAYPHSRTEDTVPITAKRSRLDLKSTPTVQNMQRQAGGTNIGAAQQTSGLPVYADILLDVNTAANNLHISKNRKTASWSDRSQNHTETPERFQWSQVLSSQRFSSGRHYWEVDVGKSENWRVGMCYPSIDRRGDQSLIGYNNKSWCLERGYNQYSVRHDNKEIRLPDEIPSDRVRICLDYEAGQISFYALCDPIRHLHTFTAAFTEPLYAGLWVWGGYLTTSAYRVENFLHLSNFHLPFICQ